MQLRKAITNCDDHEHHVLAVLTIAQEYRANDQIRPKHLTKFLRQALIPQSYETIISAAIPINQDIELTEITQETIGN